MLTAPSNGMVNLRGDDNLEHIELPALAVNPDHITATGNSQGSQRSNHLAVTTSNFIKGGMLFYGGTFGLKRMDQARDKSDVREFA